MFKKMVFILLLLLTTVALIACGGQQQEKQPGAPAAGTQTGNSSSPDRPSNGEINVYTSVPEELINELVARFQEKHPELQVKVYRAGTPDILAKIETEKKAGSVQADVVWVAESTATEDLKEMGLLRPYASPEAGSIPGDLKDADGYYYGSRLINMVLAYNTKLVSPPPTTWRDLIDPSHKGKIGLPSPANSGSALYAVGALVENSAFGWQFINDIRANGGMQLKNNSDAVQKVASGELHLAVALDYQIKGLRDEGSPIDYVVPKEGLVMVASPVALLTDSPNPYGGELFLDYVLSRDCQEFMASSQNVVPVRTDVRPPAGVPALQELKLLPVDPLFIKKNKAELVEQFTKIFTS